MNNSAKEIRSFSRFAESSVRIINNGFSMSESYGASKYLPIHLFIALLKEKNKVVIMLLERVGINLDETIISLENFAKNTGEKSVKAPEFDQSTKQLINEAISVAAELGDVFIGPEHLLLAFFKVENIHFLQNIKDLSVSYQSLREALSAMLPFPNALPADISNGMKGDINRSILPSFCTDMNQLAVENRYSQITGRDEEIQRLIHILSRKTKNNPILVGDAGVGKTAIVEGFVNLIVTGQVPSSFMNKRILNLDLAAIISGAKLRGDVEERITAVINEAIEDRDTIIFIDEIHNIVGAGTAGSKDSFDIANILKPYLTGGELSIIGATTSDEYEKYFEGDSALTRRFQSIKVKELDVESAKSVLMQLKSDFEKYHRVKISNEAVSDAVELTKRFITDRFLPDKAIDVIDEAAASLKIGREIAIEPELSTLGEELVSAQAKKNEELSKDNFEQATAYKKKEEEIVKQITNVIEGKAKVKQRFSKTVNSSLIKDIIYKSTRIPLVKKDINDKTLVNLKKNLMNKIFGQDHVIDNVTTAIQKSHLGLSSPNRPLASMLFLGPTGVGKTELAKSIAKELFGSSEMIFQLNMSEFMEMHSVAKLIGAPPGYIGYQEGGQLTAFVKKNPYSVILFDEIEKAHPDTLNILLQILEEGQLTDGKGNIVNMKNSVVILTSNIGAEEVAQDNKLGFDVIVKESETEEFNEAYEEMKDKIMDELRLSLRPEFLNRLDIIEVFRGLNKQDCLKITTNEINALKIRLVKNRIILNVTNDVIASVNEDGYSKEYGGRNIRRKVQEQIENGLATFLVGMKGNLTGSNKVLQISCELDEEKKIVFKIEK